MNGQVIRVVHILEATTGGTARWLEHVLLGMDSPHIEHACICSLSRDSKFLEVIEQFKKKGLTVWRVDMERGIHPYRDWISLNKIIDILRNNPVDIVHAHSAKGGMLGRMAARIARVPVSIYTPHAYAFLAKGFGASLYRFLEWCALPITDYVMAVSSDEAALAHKLGMPSDRIFTVFNAVDARRKLHDREYPTPQKFKIGTVAAMRAQKDPTTFIEAASIVAKQEPNVEFIYCGSGALEYQVHQKIMDLNLLPQFILKGDISDVLSEIHAWDVFVLSSLYEGLPYSVLEAMQAKLPVVATNVQGTREVVVDNETGLLVPPGDPKPLAEAILRLIRRSEGRSSMGKCGFERVHRYFTTEKQFDRLYYMYTTTLGQSTT